MIPADTITLVEVEAVGADPREPVLLEIELDGELAVYLINGTRVPPEVFRDCVAALAVHCRRQGGE